MKYEEQYGPDKSYEDLINKTVHGLMSHLNLQDFEPSQNGIYTNKQTGFICDKFKLKLSDNTYWRLKEFSEENKFNIILKSDIPVVVGFAVDGGQLNIIHPKQNTLDIFFEFKELWLSFKRLRECLIKVLVEAVKMAHGSHL
jgi:hypothetical protein